MLANDWLGFGGIGLGLLLFVSYTASLNRFLEYSSGPSRVPVELKAIAPVNSLGTDDINQCGSV